MKIPSKISIGLIGSLFFLFNSLPLFSQNHGLNPTEKISNQEHRSWDHISGIPIQRVYDIEQDELGYIWIGCDKGMLRFDGAEALSYTYKNHQVLKTDNVNFIEISKDGLVWFANRRGVFYLKGQTINEVKLDNKSILQTFSMEMDNAGKLWITSRRGKLTTIENFKAQDESNIFNERVYKVYTGNNNVIWMTTGFAAEMNLWRMNKQNHFIQRTMNRKITGLISSFSENKNGDIVFGTFDGDIFELEDNSVKFLLKNKALSNYREGIILDDNGAIWIGSQGLQRLYKGTEDIYQQKDGLGNNNINSLFFDKDQNLWVATESGLNYIHKSPFNAIKLNDGDATALRCVLEGDFHEILVGSNLNGLLLKEGNQLKELPALSDVGNKVMALASTSIKGEYIIGSDAGLFRIKNENGRFKIIQKYLDESVSVVFEASNGDIWFTKNNAVGFRGTEGATFVLSKGEVKQIDILNKLNVFAIVETETNDLWFSTSQGLFKYPVNNRDFILFKNKTINNKYTKGISIDEFGTIWVGTYGSGLYLIDNKDKVRHLDSRNGLPVNQVPLHLVSRNKSLWFFSPDKLHGKLQKLYFNNVLKDSTNAVGVGKAYSIPYQFGYLGMQGFPTEIQAMDGSYYIPTNTALLQFDPNSLKKIKPSLSVIKVLSNGELIDKTRTINFKSNQFNFEIHYSSLDLIRGNNQSFQYKLEGFDSEWQDVGSRRIAYYSSLPAGDYEFRLRVLSDTGNFIELENPLSISKAEYWYRTGTAYFMYVIGVLVLVVLIFQIRLRSIKKQRKKLSDTVVLRTTQLRELNQSLEDKVKERTKELSLINAELNISDERYKYALDASNDGIWDWNVKSDKIKFSSAIYTMLGYAPYEFEESREEIYHRISDQNQREILIENHNKLMTEGSDKQLLDEYKMKKKDGETIWVQVKGKIVERDTEGKPARMVGTHTDITADKIRTQEMLEAILKTENIERSRISRDIHDGLQQTLTISSLNFQTAKKDLNKLGDSAKEKFEVGWNYLQDSIKESRVVAHSLMPKAIIDFGVISAFESLIDQMDKSSESITFNFAHNFKQERIENQQIEITLYRILQESINNIIKYSKAKVVSIQLKDYDDMYMLTIEDDGVGFDIQKITDKNKGLGFQSMRNRLDAINGFLEIDSRIGRGTTILVEINKSM